VAKKIVPNLLEACPYCGVQEPLHWFAEGAFHMCKKCAVSFLYHLSEKVNSEVLESALQEWKGKRER
jgi:hypothetical protein